MELKDAGNAVATVKDKHEDERIGVSVVGGHINRKLDEDAIELTTNDGHVVFVAGTMINALSEAVHQVLERRATRASDPAISKPQTIQPQAQEVRDSDGGADSTDR